MNYLIVIILIISICSLFALVIYRLNDIKEEIKKQNEYWKSLDKHFDKTINFWINIVDYIKKGGKDE